MNNEMPAYISRDMLDDPKYADTFNNDFGDFLRNISNLNADQINAAFHQARTGTVHTVNNHTWVTTAKTAATILAPLIIVAILILVGMSAR